MSLIRKVGDMPVELVKRPGSLRRTAVFQEGDGLGGIRFAYTARLDPEAQYRQRIPEACEMLYYVLEGSGRLSTGSAESPVQAGDAALIPEGSHLRLQNTGSLPLEFLYLCVKIPPDQMDNKKG